MNARTVTVICLMLVAPCAPQVRADPPVSCGELPCRANGLAYISESGGVVIQPGEKFAVELTIADDKIAALTPRKAQSDLKNAITLEFEKTEQGVMLTVGNSSGRTVKYDAFMKLPNRGLIPTSSCPVMSGPFGMELWADAIEFLELRNLRFLPQGSGMACQ